MLRISLLPVTFLAQSLVIRQPAASATVLNSMDMRRLPFISPANLTTVGAFSPISPQNSISHGITVQPYLQLISAN